MPSGGHNIVDYVGRRFNRLTVMERVGSTKHKKSLWRCSCECGSDKDIFSVAGDLKRGKVSSCGCIRSLPKGESSRNFLFRNYKRRAIERGLEFSITLKQFSKLTQDNCFYCGLEPLQTAYAPSNMGSYVYNGIDRYNNNHGYILENCVTCCSTCNYAKRNMTATEFITWIERVYTQTRSKKVLINE